MNLRQVLFPCGGGGGGVCGDLGSDADKSNTVCEHDNQPLNNQQDHYEKVTI